MTEAAIEAALLAASLMLCTTVPVTEEPALPLVPDDFLEAVGDFAAADFPEPEAFAAKLPDFVAAGLAAAAFGAAAEVDLDVLD